MGQEYIHLSRLKRLDSDEFALLLPLNRKTIGFSLCFEKSTSDNTIFSMSPYPFKYIHLMASTRFDDESESIARLNSSFSLRVYSSQARQSACLQAKLDLWLLIKFNIGSSCI